MSTALSALLVPIDHDHKAMPYATVLPSSGYVWVAYQKDPPYLPIAVADSAEVLARLLGVTQNSIESRWYKYRHGKARASLYHRVKI